LIEEINVPEVSDTEDEITKEHDQDELQNIFPFTFGKEVGDDLSK
jgi:hypothetical protein